MNDFLKGILLTAVPTAALSIVSAVGVRSASGESGVLFVFLWFFAVAIFLVTTVLGLVGPFFKHKGTGRAGAVTGITVGVVSLGLSCFAMFTPATPTPVTQPSTTRLPLPTSKPAPAPFTTRTETVSPPESSPSLAPELNLGNPVISGLQVTINGVTMPGIRGTTISKINWDWGDGSSEDRWFPASHSYIADGLYVVKVTSYQSDGRQTIRSLTVRTGPQRPAPSLVTRSGTCSGFYDFPSTFFEESKVPIEGILKVTDAQYLGLKKMHNGISPYSFCKIEYEPAAYGFTTSSGLKLGDPAFPGLYSGNPRWEVLAHEQGHNFFGGTSAFYSVLAVPSPFLQESLAVAGAFYTYHDIVQNKEAYDIDDISIGSLDFDFANGRMYQQAMFNKYIQEGKNFDMGQVLTSQALDFKMITYGETYGWQNFQRLARAFENDLSGRFNFQRDGVSPNERSTYVVAALTVAFGKDLRQEFRDLNFPIDDELFEECRRTITSYIEGR